MYMKNKITKTHPSKAILSALAMLVMGISLTACSSTHNSDIMVGDIMVHDPLEDTNRAVFAFNDVVSDGVIHPVVEGYRFAVPQPARSGLRNFLRNLKSPMTFVNQMLQGDVEGGGRVLLRTTVNTLVGFGGLFDVAGYEGYKYEAEDFGQTLAVWGVGHGPYMVVPFLGPSSLRDYVGYAVDSFADPLRFYTHNIDEEGWYYAKLGLDYLTLRESFIDVLKDLEASSIDYYASVRSTYYQSRSALIHDQSNSRTTRTAPVVDENSYPDFEDF